MYIKAVPSVHDRKIHGIHGLISSLLSVGRLIWAHCRHNPPREQGIHPPLPLYRLLRPSPIICQLPPVHGTGHSCPDCAHGLISFSHFLPSWTTPSPQGLLSRCYWHLVCRCKWALVYVILHLLPFLDPNDLLRPRRDLILHIHIILLKFPVHCNISLTVMIPNHS